MTDPQPSRHWPDADQWTGFVLLLVPTPGLPEPAQDLHRQVSARLRSHVVLHDLVTVGLAPIIDGSRNLDTAVAAAVLTTAEHRGHYIAPRAFFGCVVMGGAAEQIDDAQRALAEHPLLRRMNAVVYTQVVTELEPAVTAITKLPEQMMLAYERQPHLAIDEPTYLAEVVELHAELGRSSPPRPVPRAVHDGIAGPRPPAVHRDDRLVLRPPHRRRLLAGLSRRAAPDLPEAYWLDHLASTAQAAALVFLVFVPDHDRPAKRLANRRKAVVLALDDTLGRVRAHPATGRDLNVVVEVLVATSPLRRSTTLRPAGILTERDLAKVPTENFDIYDAVELLIEAQERAAGALTRRGVEVTSLHVIFLATTAPWPSEEAQQRFAALAARAWISWVHLGDSHTYGSVKRFAALDPGRIHSHQDQPDIVSEVLNDAAALYGRPDLTPEPSELPEPPEPLDRDDHHDHDDHDDAATDQGHDTSAP